MSKIWLIGGTSESREIAQALVRASLSCIVTVTTPSAQTLYPTSPYLKIYIGILDPDKLNQFLTSEAITGIVDASHPYALQISQIAIETALTRNIPYLRYERPRAGTGAWFDFAHQPPPLHHANHQDTLIELDSLTTLLNGEYLNGKRVLLTLGYKSLPHFQPWQTRSTLYARILPSVNSLEVAIAAGFSSDRLIALRPPISAELEKALWQQWNLSLVVTKASGTAGGEEIKRQVATELGIPLIIIARPNINYPQQTHQISEVISFCRQIIQGNP